MNLRPPASSLRPRSAGALLYLVIALGAALGTLAFAVSWSSGSGYALSASDASRVAADASGSSIADAAALAFDGAVGDAAPKELRDLRDRLYDALALVADQRWPWPPAGVSVQADVPPSVLPSLAAGGDVTLERLTFSLHDFQPLAYGPDAPAFASSDLFYHESLFHDESKDLVPHDFAGFLTVEAQLATRERGRLVHRTFRTTRDAKVVDVTPPAREYGIFSYGVPPDTSYMLNDLNSGGHLAVYSSGSRAFVRGPLFLAVEDAADPVHTGGDLRPRESISYPEIGRDWHGWAFIPGPREVKMPNFAGSASELLGEAASWLGATSVTPHPRRPPAAHDGVSFPFLGSQIPGVLLIGPAASPALGAFFPLPHDQQIACAGPWVYLTGTVLPGRQTFSLAGDPDPAHAVDGTSVAMYDGMRAHKGGDCRGTYAEQLRFPHGKYADGQPVEDGDAVYPEPFSHESANQTSRTRPFDQGIYGLYKIAEFHRNLIFDVKLAEFLADSWPPARALTFAGQSVLKQFGINPDIWLIAANWNTSAPPDLQMPLLPEFLEDVLDKQQYFIAPYGLYFESEQNRALMMEVETLFLGMGITFAARKLEKWTLGKLFRDDKSEAEKLGDKAVHALKDKIFNSRFGRWGEKVGSLMHPVMRWLTENFVGDGIRAVFKVMAKLTFRSAVEGLTFVSTWRAVGYLRTRQLRAALGQVAKWEPPPRSTDLATDFPKGLYPPKYRPYGKAATRMYASFDELRAHHTAADGVLEVNEVMLVRELAYHATEPVRYRGRGAIVALGGKGDEGPVLDAPVVRAEPEAYLTLVVEDVSDDTLAQNSMKGVRLGSVFQGTVYSSAGARPAGDATVILGNLVTLHMNKARVPTGSRLDVVYDPDRLPAAADRNGHKDWWRLVVSPRSAGLED